MIQSATPQRVLQIPESTTKLTEKRLEKLLARLASKIMKKNTTKLITKTLAVTTSLAFLSFSSSLMANTQDASEARQSCKSSLQQEEQVEAVQMQTQVQADSTSTQEYFLEELGVTSQVAQEESKAVASEEQSDLGASTSVATSTPPSTEESLEAKEPREETSRDLLIKGILLISSRNKMVPSKEAAKVRGVQVKDVVLPKGLVGINDCLYHKVVNYTFCKAWLKSIQCDLVKYYQDCNHPFVVVEVPEQDITDGVVQIVVKEGKVGKIVCTGNEYYPKDYFADLLGLREGSYLGYDVLSESIDWLGIHPFHQADVIFKPGENEGDIDVEIIAHDRRPARVYGGTDNSGTQATGFGRLFGGIILDNVFKSGGVLNYQYKASYDCKKLQSNFLGYMVPFRCGHILSVYGLYSTIRPDIPLFKSKGIFGQGSLRYSLPIKWKLCRWLNNVNFGLDYKRLNNNLFFVDSPEVAITDGGVNITQVLMSYSLGQHHKKWSISLNTQFVGSPGGWLPAQSNADYQSLQNGASSSYAYAAINSELLFYLPHEWSVTFRTVGQVSTGTLLPSEQYSLGGVQSVRGYDQGEYLADNGIGINTEFYLPPLPIKAKNIKSYLLFFGFVDTGFGYQYTPLAGTNRMDYLIGVGPGLRYHIDKYLQVDLDWGAKLHRVKGGSNSWQKFKFSITASY